MLRPQRLAFSIGRWIGTHPLASRLFCLMEPILPLERLGRSSQSVAFVHPRPSYDPHVLIVPTIPFPSLLHAPKTPHRRAAILWEMIELGREVLVGPATDWQMIVNGGTRQDIGQVHGHLVHAEEHVPTSHRFDLLSPSIDSAPWGLLLDRIDSAAKRPDAGYSLVFQLSDQGSISAWITESGPI